jgi:hypothetical protein
MRAGSNHEQSHLPMPARPRRHTVPSRRLLAHCPPSALTDAPDPEQTHAGPASRPRSARHTAGTMTAAHTDHYGAGMGRLHSDRSPRHSALGRREMPWSLAVVRPTHAQRPEPRNRRSDRRADVRYMPGAAPVQAMARLASAVSAASWRGRRPAATAAERLAIDRSQPWQAPKAWTP